MRDEAGIRGAAIYDEVVYTNENGSGGDGGIADRGFGDTTGY